MAHWDKCIDNITRNITGSQMEERKNKEAQNREMRRTTRLLFVWILILKFSLKFTSKKLCWKENDNSHESQCIWATFTSLWWKCLTKLHVCGWCFFSPTLFVWKENGSRCGISAPWHLTARSDPSLSQNTSYESDCQDVSAVVRTAQAYVSAVVRTAQASSSHTLDRHWKFSINQHICWWLMVAHKEPLSETSLLHSETHFPASHVGLWTDVLSALVCKRVDWQGCQWMHHHD